MHIKQLFVPEDTSSSDNNNPLVQFYSTDESTLNPEHHQADQTDQPMYQYEARPSTANGAYKIPTLFSSKSLTTLNSTNLVSQSLNMNQQQNNPPLTQSEFEQLKKALSAKINHQSSGPPQQPNQANIDIR